MEQLFLVKIYTPPGFKERTDILLQYDLSKVLVNAGYTNAVEYVEKVTGPNLQEAKNNLEVLQKLLESESGYLLDAEKAALKTVIAFLGDSKHSSMNDEQMYCHGCKTERCEHDQKLIKELNTKITKSMIAVLELSKALALLSSEWASENEEKS